MNTDLVGGQELVTHINALQEQLAEAQKARNAAAEALKRAKADDIDAAVEAMRAGATAPESTEAAAEKRWNEAERHLTVVSLALKAERQALTADITSRSDEIVSTLAKAEDGLTEGIDSAITGIEAMLAERASIIAHRMWVRSGATGSVGMRRDAGEGELRALRAAVAESGGGAFDKEVYLRNYDAWTALVERASATVPYADRIPVRDVVSGFSVVPEVDAAIEREVERLEEAGEPVPTPTSIKWAQKLGSAVKPKGEGMGWQHQTQPVPTVMEPDTDSAAARHSDNVKVKA
jgi:hypothetical protein